MVVICIKTWFIEFGSVMFGQPFVISTISEEKCRTSLVQCAILSATRER